MGGVMKPQREIIKCRFCGWSCPKWRGRGKNNYRLLRRHVGIIHPDEYESIIDKLMEEDEMQEWGRNS